MLFPFVKGAADRATFVNDGPLHVKGFTSSSNSHNLRLTL